MHTEVLIVGAGPTGLMLANQLGRRGLRATIIDRHGGPAQQTRAMAVHARTLEIYAQLGVVEQALALGRRATGANVWVRGRRRARVPLGDIGKALSPFPFVLMLGQDDNERILGEQLGRWGMAVEWNTELVALEQRADCVIATLGQRDGTRRRIEARYVAGCDGSRSAVRELNGIAFPGAPYEHTFFVADTEATGPMTPDELNVYLWRDGFHLLFPMRGANRWRVIGILPEDLRDRDGLRFEDVMPGIRGASGVALAFHSCSWFSTYRIFHRCTERFRAGRCFVLGDAAHVHSPMGGQGMNTGLQDAYNLAWKLALVLGGRAAESLLDTYEAERIGVARRLLATTDRAFRLVVADHWIAALFRTRLAARVVAWAMGRARIRTRAFRALSQIGIRYRDSRLARTLDELPAGAPRGGDRFPWLQLELEGAHGETTASGQADLFRQLDDTRFNLLVFGQPGPAGPEWRTSGLLRVLVVPDEAQNAAALARAGIPRPSFYLLRPDGYIGLAGARWDAPAVQRYLAEAEIDLQVDAPVGPHAEHS